MLDIQPNMPLAPYTSLKIGGPARFFAAPENLDELRETLLFARRKGLPLRVIGGGTNLLVGDGGFDGLILRLNFGKVRVTGDTIEAEAGVDLNALVENTATRGLGGMEALAGIPGLLGGAVRGNAGAYGCSIGELTREVTALDSESLELVTLKGASCAFAYRDSLFKNDPRLIVLSALLALSPADGGEIRRKIGETIAKRTAKKLDCQRSVGSFFMNPVVTDRELLRRFESEQRVPAREGRIPAGWLIERAGLRHARVGGAMVSELHANYLINSGNATAGEMARLACRIKSGVWAAMGVRLQEEVSYLGMAPEEEQEPSPVIPPGHSSGFGANR